ncbi:WD-40 repeat protein [Reticulomyxa filosa]|uniref:WD-40 repeat protein n=1 Tax=Reticulomyxa filosa TaxID=46433 RepID=X6NGX2_RETFI|nr:WD-40 repeat protein [Reticulomyxa filosa]|eukprot:ETO25236.1 WD-40 repeat protein [Reticulomyxa filosa]
MLMLQIEESNLKDSKTLPVKKCYNKDWISFSVKSSTLKNFQCLLCKQIANNAMELICNEHKDYKESVIGEQCLLKYLNENNNKCPIGDHNNCNYIKGQTARNCINELRVICPRQFKNEIKKPIECKFKRFGCNDILCNFNIEKHLQSGMDKHFNLLLNYIEKQDIQFRQLIEKNKEYQVCLLYIYIYIYYLYTHLYHILYKKDELNQLRSENDQLKLNQLRFKNDQLKFQDEKKKDDKITENQIKHDEINQNKLNCMKSLKTLNGHNGTIYSIDSLNNDKYICSGSSDNTIRVWDIETSKQIQMFHKHLGSVICVKYSPYHSHNNNGDVICSSSYDNTIRFWDIKNNQQLQILNENKNENYIYDITFSPFNNGRYLCSGSNNYNVHLWDIEKSKSLHVFNGHRDIAWCIDFSPLQSNINICNIGTIGGNGYTICSGSRDKTIRLWDIETTKQSMLFEGHQDCIMSIKHGSHELKDMILSGSMDKTIRLWDIRYNKQIQLFNGHLKSIWSVKYLPNNNNIICSGSIDNTIRFWDVRSNKNQLHVIKGDDKKDNGIICFKFLSSKNNNHDMSYSCLGTRWREERMNTNNVNFFYCLITLTVDIFIKKSMFLIQTITA